MLLSSRWWFRRSVTSFRVYWSLCTVCAYRLLLRLQFGGANSKHTWCHQNGQIHITEKTSGGTENTCMGRPWVGVEEKMKVFSSCFKEMFVLTQSLISGCIPLLINCIWLPRSIGNNIGQSVLLCACYDSARPLLRLFCLYGNKNSYELPDGLCRWRLGAKSKV